MSIRWQGLYDWGLRTRGSVFSCVVDQSPRFQDQCALWVNSLLYYQRLPASRLVVHLVAPASAALLRWLRQRGVRCVVVAPFDARSPHCNKLRQLETDFGQARQVLLMDCDTVWLGRERLPAVKALAAKRVDGGNPAPAILQRIFAASGLGDPRWAKIGFPRPDAAVMTDRDNCNGGLYIANTRMLPILAEVWARWARWCMDRRELFGSSIHFDQVSYALAVRELGVRTQLLEPQWNYPTHFPHWELPDVEPQILHYHHCYRPDLSLLPVGVARPDAAIARFNARMQPLMADYRKAFPAA
jgi:hypothetical protein